MSQDELSQRTKISLGDLWQIAGALGLMTIMLTTMFVKLTDVEGRTTLIERSRAVNHDAYVEKISNVAADVSKIKDDIAEIKLQLKEIRRAQ